MDPPSKFPTATVNEQPRGHKKHHDRPLRWFQSPVSHDEHVPAPGCTGDNKFEQIPVPLGHNTQYQSLNDNEQQSWFPTRLHPVFKRHGESTPLELFYDLFFVANLTAFTSTHHINDGFNLRSYIGFFALLWFTWFNVSLYDLRLGRDSVFDRCLKAVQFGIMIGFVAVGVDFTPNISGEFESGQTMALLLGGSRFALCAQYIAAFFFLKHYKGALPPMIMTIATTFVAGVAYVGTSFAFPPFNEHLQKPYIAWYFICGIETALTLFASMKWRLLSFKGTHIVERMSLLTLIILGEGIIGMAEAIHAALESDLAGNVGSTTASFRGAIVSAILILYFLYMLYFDNVPEEHFGTIRSQIWAWAHFPLHVCLVLFVEGSAQGLKWRRIQGQLDILFQQYENNELMNNALFPWFGAFSPEELSNSNKTVLAFMESHNTTDGGRQYFSDQALDLASTFSYIGSSLSLADIESYNECLTALYGVADGYKEELLHLLTNLLTIYAQSTATLLKAFGAELPEEESGKKKKTGITLQGLGFTNSTDDSDSNTDGGSERRSLLFRRQDNSTDDAEGLEFYTQVKKLNDQSDLFQFSFMYFYITGGLALLTLGVIAMLGKKSRWNRWDAIRFSSFFVFGITLGLLSLTALTEEGAQGLPSSPMVVPLAMLLVFAPVIFNHL